MALVRLRAVCLNRLVYRKSFPGSSRFRMRIELGKRIDSQQGMQQSGVANLYLWRAYLTLIQIFVPRL